MSDHDDCELRLYVQIRKIEIDRYDEGKRRGHDPRDDGNYDLEWVQAPPPGVPIFAGVAERHTLET